MGLPLVVRDQQFLINCSIRCIHVWIKCCGVGRHFDGEITQFPQACLFQKYVSSVSYVPGTVLVSDYSVMDEISQISLLPSSLHSKHGWG